MSADRGQLGIVACNSGKVFADAMVEYLKDKYRKEHFMNKNSIIQLLVAIFAFGLFCLSWLVFKNIKTTDWVILAVGVLDLIVFFMGLKKNKK